MAIVSIVLQVIAVLMILRDDGLVKSLLSIVRFAIDS